MKKNLYVILFCTVIGLFMGTYMFSQYDKNEIEPVSAGSKFITETIYAFQYGVYSNKENMISNLNNINYVYELLDNKYYVYVGMTKNKDNIDKLKNYFKSLSYDIYVKEINVNGEFAENLGQFDLLLDEAVTNESISTILKTTLAKFEELAIDDKNQRITN